MTSAQWGEWLFSSYGCAACHSVASAPGIGPALNDIAGTERDLADGTTALADTSYLRAALLEPSEHISLGYEPRMPSYELSYPQVDALVDYLNHLGGVTREE
ncbi:MAG: cytochrome c oxidase subunit 2 [Polyangiales bacterium]|jgi:cytochrome c oxidase subunit 2